MTTHHASEMLTLDGNLRMPEATQGETLECSNTGCDAFIPSSTSTATRNLGFLLLDLPFGGRAIERKLLLRGCTLLLTADDTCSRLATARGLEPC